MVFADASTTTLSEEQVYAAIADVLDPELDESLLKLGFIDSVQIDGGTVTVFFKLPTYWCAPNFAYLMASDLRSRVKTLPGVTSTRILLLDHCTSDEVSDGVNSGQTFIEAFPDEAEDNLEELRLIFLRKGFLVRQDALLRRLQLAGLDENTMLSLRVADLAIDESTQQATITTTQQTFSLERAGHIAQTYLRRSFALGIHHAPDDLLFLDDKSQPIAPGGLQAYLRQSRSVRMNIIFNTVFCTDMFQTRYGPGASKILPEGEKA